MYQTLEGFLRAPFGSPEPKSNEFEQKYQRLKSNKRIYIEASTRIEDNYLLHIKVGSDSNQNVFYDVILLFFTDDPKISKDISFRNYYVQFFSNSPSFIYQYAVLYKQNHALIEMLYDKMEEEFADKAPEKANPNMKLSYDKSIYSACRYMQDNPVSAFSKAGMLVRKKKTPEKFFSDIKTFANVKLDNEINQLDKKVDRELDKVSKEKSKTQSSNKPKGRSGSSKKKPVKNTLTDPKKSSIKVVSKSASIKSKKPKRRSLR